MKDTFKRSCEHWSEKSRNEMQNFYTLASVDYKYLAEKFEWKKWFEVHQANVGERSLKLLDVACGSGKFPSALVQYAKLSDAKILLRNGADKISVNSAAVRTPDLINQLSESFGNQCVVVAIDAKKINGRWMVHLVGGKVPTDIELKDWVKEVESRGAGEILFTSMDHDGTKNGFANHTLAELSVMVNIPIIASGGAGATNHFVDVFKIGKADAALAASVFHYGEIKIPNLKKVLKKENIEIRITNEKS